MKRSMPRMFLFASAESIVQELSGGFFKSEKRPLIKTMPRANKYRSPFKPFNHCVPFKTFTKPVPDVAPLHRRVGHLFQREENGWCLLNCHLPIRRDDLRRLR